MSPHSTIDGGGFTIRNGNAFFSEGGGVLIRGRSPIIQDNVITRNVAAFGGRGVEASNWNGLELAFTDAIVRNNTITPPAGAMRSYDDVGSARHKHRFGLSRRPCSETLADTSIGPAVLRRSPMSEIDVPESATPERIRPFRHFRLAFALCLVLGSTAPAIAQMPPHAPGTICSTPAFWCWAQPAEPPGAVCFCPTPQGAVRGVLR